MAAEQASSRRPLGSGTNDGRAAQGWTDTRQIARFTRTQAVMPAIRDGLNRVRAIKSKRARFAFFSNNKNKVEAAALSDDSSETVASGCGLLSCTLLSFPLLLGPLPVAPTRFVTLLVVVGRKCSLPLGHCQMKLTGCLL